MTSILLTTLNARYAHTSVALRYLYANMNELQKDTQILEFVIKQDIETIANELLQCRPKIIGIGVYIWNASQIEKLLRVLKELSPETIIVLGGPEVSYEPYRVDISKADHIIQGEGEEAFYTLCKDLLEGKHPIRHTFPPMLLDAANIVLPYEYYSREDIARRHIYVEASRGCPFRCEFCLSSIDKKVRYFDEDLFLDSLEALWVRGARNFRFIDRTFNLNISYANRLLDFFLTKNEQYFVHFEVIPEVFPKSLRDRLVKFTSGSLQLEVGIQTLYKTVAKNISRPLNFRKIEENIIFLESHTKAHLHLDLIVGLPGESLEQFGYNLDKLMSLSRAEIQVGILKKLSGTRINRHDEEHGMVYSEMPPYDIISNKLLSAEVITEMKRFARYWDLCYNSGNFNKTVKYIWGKESVFENFRAFCIWLYERSGVTIFYLDILAEHIFNYLTDVKGMPNNDIAKALLDDLMKVSGRRVPKFLHDYAKHYVHKEAVKLDASHKRQQKHL